jgi:hypothetical protein
MTGQMGDLDYGSAPSSWNPNGGTLNIGIFVDSRVLCGEVDSFSDARIKVIEGRADTRAALETVNRLQLTDYRYIDQAQHGSQRHVGVLAQEAEAVMPDAVSQTTEFIPNIFAYAARASFDAAARQLTVTLAEPHGLVAGDVVKLAGARGSFSQTVVATPDANTFVVGDVPAAEPQVFVIGKQVNDFRVVKYEDLFATGLAAIQQLSKEHQEMKSEDAEFFRRLDALETKVGK